MSPVKEGRKFKRSEEQSQSSPTNPKINTNTSQNTNNWDIDKNRVKDKQTKK